MIKDVSPQRAATRQSNSEQAFSLATAAMNAQIFELSSQWPTATANTQRPFPSSCGPANAGASFCPNPANSNGNGSFGNGYRLTNDRHYKDVIIEAANTLSTRFNPKIGCIRSWDHHKDQWEFPVIIDNMMNLELLFWATKYSGDSLFYKIAVTHANTTMKNHFRPDYSSYHVVVYDPQTGAVKQRKTAQGAADESAWARGLT